MRASFALLALALAGCSAHTVSDLNSWGKPAETPLGTTADRDAPAAQLPAPAPDEALAAAPTNWPAPFVPGATCQLTARQAAAIWQRPVAGVPLFGHLAVGDKVTLAAQTADGWVGFDPGTAQAANVGIFRLRWVRANEAFGVGKSCGQLPVVSAPPPGCLLMAPRATTVRRQPASSAAPLGTIPAGSYAQVVKSAANKWLEVRVPGQTEPGYVAPADASLSGNCP